MARAARAVRAASVDWFVVAGCVLFAFLNLHPEEILDRAVASGGDMGAHVWGPAFLRDHLLPDGRLSGWTPDWYAGFPAYHFYMVVPSLLIVALDVGVFSGWLMIVPLAAGGGLVYASTRLEGWRRWATVAAAVLIVVFGVELPYGTAFKLVTVLGVLTLPVCAYAFGRLADLPFPGPALLSVASVLFLFDRNFTIYGGNVASTLAGEFAFSISLSLALLYLGVVIRGLRTGQHRALAAVLLALTGLCHLIPAFFALAGTFVIAVMRRPRVRTAIWVGVRAAGGRADQRLLGAAVLVAARLRERHGLGEAALRDGRRTASGRCSGTLFTLDGDTYWKYLIPRSVGGMPNDMRWVLALACVGVVLSIAFRIRVGLYLAGCTLLMAVAFVAVGEGRLWNARLLPFYYLGLYLLAAIGVAEVIRTVAILVARDPDRPSVVGPAVAAGVVTRGRVRVRRAPAALAAGR